MAKRTRTPARRSPNSKTARQAYKDAHQTPPQQPAIKIVSHTRRAVGGTIEYTPELLENARHRVEETDEPLTSIAADLGIHRTTFDRVILRQGWNRPPRDLSSAAKLLIQAEQLESSKQTQSAQPPENNGEEVLPAVTVTIDRLHRAALKELSAIETMRAKLGREPQRPVDAERTVRTLGKITEILQKIQRMQCATTQPGPHDDDIPTDINEFRRQLAHRINAFVESRTGGGDAGASGA